MAIDKWVLAGDSCFATSYRSGEEEGREGVLQSLPFKKRRAPGD